MPDANPLELNTAEQAQLLTIAREVITHACRGTAAPRYDPDQFGPRLRAPAACFVTLTRHGQLRGCIGSLEPRQALLDDVVHNARASAMSDPRFAPLRESELGATEIEISVLGPVTKLDIHSETELRQLLRPRVDGLVLDDGKRRATFLPMVWDTLPRVDDFISQLKRKAGWATGYWHGDIRAYTYQTLEFSETA